MSSKTIDVRLIPMQQNPLLIPAACIADVVDYSRPTDQQSKQGWYLGEIPWRGLSIPLVAFERINNGRFAEISVTARIAVMHSTTGNEQQPFYGVVVQGMPQEFKVTETEISTAPGSGPAEISRVLVRGIPAAIPDLKQLEKKLAEELVGELAEELAEL